MRKLKYSSLVFLFFLISCAGAGAEQWARDPRWARPVSLPGSSNLFEVTPDFYRSAQTDAEAFKEYEKFGIKTVINLRAFHSDRDEVRGTGLNLIEVPIHTWSIEDDEVIAALWHIKNEPGPVMLHCWHGADRTGTVVAIYRMAFQGWSREEALDELINGGYGYHSIWKGIPKYIRSVDIDKIKAGALQAEPPDGVSKKR
ncbi:protein-tyrosine-phosphatase [Deltaproteobacteria bacterium Smac51]|nr:protein-tyrosine-phosphatase [Deltaproteobacteria bacterium Smac51]